MTPFPEACPCSPLQTPLPPPRVTTVLHSTQLSQDLPYCPSGGEDAPVVPTSVSVTLLWVASLWILTLEFGPASQQALGYFLLETFVP